MNTTNLNPTQGRILVKEIERKDLETSSGVFLPGQTLQEENLLYGEVIEHKPTKESPETFISGQHVFYSRYSATSVRDSKGDKYLIVSDLDVQAYENK